MTNLNRRQFATGLGVATATTAVVSARFALALGAAKIVIIGGGPAGASVAGLLKKGEPSLDVTLVEPKDKYASCFFSNHYIGGMRSFSSITHNYTGLKSIGVTIVRETAAAIDIERKEVVLKSKRKLAYDRLVVAPGIDFKPENIERYTEETPEIMPHAWQGGWQAQRLRGLLEKMPDGGTVVIAPPKKIYRCPPGPYERACVIANYLKIAKPKSKLIILDPKMNFSKQPVFEEAFKKYYADIIELHLSNDIDDFSVTRIDTERGEVETKAGLTVKAAVANIIPEQTAGKIALTAGLAEADWCPVNPENFTSAKAKDIYVVGDAARAADMPKSAYAASSQARVVAGDILADLIFKPRGEPRYRNTCWSFLAPGDSVKIGANYAPGDLHGTPGLVASDSFVSKPGENAQLRKENYDESIAWYTTLTNEVFQKVAPSKPEGSSGAASRG